MRGLSLAEFYQAEMPEAPVEDAEKAFQLVDKDADKRISFEELQSRPPEAQFLKFDADRNGQLSLKEYESGQPAMVKSGRSKKLFAALDTNGDGAVNLDELSKKSQESQFLQKDRSGDGGLDLAEFTANAAGKAASNEENFRKKDKNADSLLDWKEFAFQPADQQFWKMDADGSGDLSMEESKAWLGTFRQSIDAKEPQEVGIALASDAKARSDSTPPDAAAAAFAALDLNHDGRLGLGEFQRPQTRDPKQVALKMLLRYDFSVVQGNRVADVSGNGHHGRIRGGKIVEGRQGKAVQLGQDGAIAVTDEQHTISPEQCPMVIGAWCKPADPNGAVVSIGGGSQGLCLYLKDGVPQFVICSGGNRSKVVADRPVALNEWVHIAAGIDADGQLWLFVNGQPAGKASGRFLQRRPNEGFSIGADTGSLVGDYTAELHWRGLLQDIRFYEGFLTGEEMLKDDHRVADVQLPPETNAPSGTPTPEQEFANLDKDSNGVLSVEEFAGQATPDQQKQASEDFLKKDANVDKRLGFREFAYRPADRIFWDLDRDGDDRLSAEEFVAEAPKQAAAPGQGAADISAPANTADAPLSIFRSELVFASMDRNADGRLSLSDFRNGPQRDPSTIERQLILRYDFNNVKDGRVIDTSGNQHDGDLRQGQVVEGRRGKAIALKGAGVVNVQAVSDSVCPTFRPFIVGAWCKPAEPDGVIAAIGGKGDGFSLYLQEGVLRFVVRSHGQLSEVASPAPVALDQWVHLAGCMDGNRRLHLYVNGQSVVDGEGLFLSRAPAEPLAVGADVKTPVAEYTRPIPWNGLLEDVRLYWGSLSPEEVEKWAE